MKYAVVPPDGGAQAWIRVFAYFLCCLGSLGWQSIQRSDFECMQAIVLTIACFYILLTFLADLLNAYLDPRIRVA